MTEKRPETPWEESVTNPEGAAKKHTIEESAPESGKQSVSASKRLYDKSFPMVVDFLVFFGIFLLSQGVGAVVAWILFGWPDRVFIDSADAAVNVSAQLAAGHFNAVSYALAMGLTLAGFLYYRYRRRGPRIIARFSLRGLNPALLLWGVVFMLGTSVVFEPVMRLLPAVPDAYGRGMWVFLSVVVLAPLLEETIFRGVILESVRAKYGVTVAWLVSSIIFGLVHLHPTLMINAFIIGLILGFLYIASSSLWTAVILHAVNNALAYLLLITGHNNAQMIDLVGNRTLYVVIYIAALAVLAVSGYMVFRTLRRMKKEDKNHAQA